MTFDTCNEQLVGISLGILHEIRGRLFSRDSNEGNTLVSGLEPDDLGPFDGTAAGILALVPFTFAALCLLLLLGRCRRWSQQAQSSGEKLTRHALHNGDNMACELRLDFVGDPESYGSVLSTINERK